MTVNVPIWSPGDKFSDLSVREVLKKARARGEGLKKAREGLKKARGSENLGIVCLHFGSVTMI